MQIRLPDLFYDNVGQKLSATKINQLIRAVQHLDRWSFRMMNTFDSSGADGGSPFYLTAGGYHTNPGWRIWRGGVLYKTGATTLTINGAATPAGAELLKVYVNGVLQDTIGSPIPSTWASTITLTGFTDGQPIWVELRIEGSSSIVTRYARYYVYDAYISPITASGWVAPTTFSGIFNATKLNAVRTAVNWLYARLNLIPLVPRLATLFEPGPYRDPALKPEFQNWPIYYGTVLRGYSDFENYRYAVQWTNYTSIQERWKLYYDGVLAYTSPTRGPGTYLDYGAILLTHAVGTRKEIWIHTECIQAGVDAPPDNPIRASRYSILQSRTEPTATGYSYWSPPTEWAYSTKTATVVNSTLNSIVNALIAIKARIDATPHIWGRWYLQRKFYGWDDTTHNVRNKRAVPQLDRLGDRLVISGKAASINFGTILLPSDSNKKIEEYTFDRNESVIGGDKIERRSIYLDNYPDLFFGTSYYAISDNDVLLEEYLY